MITKFLKKYLSIVFVLALFAGSFHQHTHDENFDAHDECQICTIATNLLNSDAPKEVIYLSKLEIKSEGIISKLVTLHLHTNENLLLARAPPLFS